MTQLNADVQTQQAPSAELDIRQPADALVTKEPDPAAARFESNRQFDRGSTMENLDRPTLVWSTRNEHKASAPKRLGGVPALAGLVVVSLGIGALLGWQLRPEDEQNSSQEPAVPIAPVREAATPVPENQSVGEEVEPSSDLAPAAGGDDSQAFLSEIAALDLSELTFVPGEINLTQPGIETTERLIDLLMAYPAQPIELRVRTYSESTPGQNHGLSVHQANVLGTVLASAGVRSDRITVVGIGSSDAIQTSSSAAIFFDSLVPTVRERLQFQGPLTLDRPFEGTLDINSRQLLAAVASAVGDSPVVLVGYTWGEPSDHLNHDLSHELLDKATLHLEAAGVPAGRITSVGLGSAPVEISQRSTVVTATTGDDAVVAVALRSIPLDAVSFMPGTGDLTPTGLETLNSVAATLESHPGAVVEAAIHSYRMPTSQANHDLSQVQADAIETYLYNQGVSSDRLRIFAHGDPPHFAVPGRDGVVTFTVVR